MKVGSQVEISVRPPGSSEMMFRPRVLKIEPNRVRVSKRDESFELTLESGTELEARRLLLATGVIDELPAIAGLQELWGVSTLHCPYCHGWEVQDELIALYGKGQVGFYLCVLLKGWSDDLVLCTDGPAYYAMSTLGDIEANDV
ncbi:hypothetical protein [Nostoc sp.]|uniref:hypothetical protein n=1 Tax=Nostoc sp. TaxID=1180 RepID=UPI002FFAAB16